jgi:hypothetical protein
MKPREYGMIEAGETTIDAVVLLQENLQSYKLLLRLAGQTHHDLASGNADALKGQMDLRLQVQAEISARDRIIEEACQHLHQTPIDDRVTELVKRSVAIIVEIQELDRKTRDLIFEERERLRGELAVLRRGKKATRGYGRGRPKPPKFLDRVG